MSNSIIWDKVQATDPAYTKSFTKPGGFSGTAINATYMAKKATEVFGPMGIGWGVDIEQEDYIEGHILNDTGQRAIIHCLRIKLWYIAEKEISASRGEITHFGQTTFVGQHKNSAGPYTDEEAPKKSLTDATTKALSMLGFSSDIYMGLYDDQAYRAEVTEKSLNITKDQSDEAKAAALLEYTNWRTSHMSLIDSAASRAELKTLHTLMVRKMTRQNDQAGLLALETHRNDSLARLEAKDNE